MLEVVPERGVLYEGLSAVGAQVRPLSRVLPEVHPQRLGQREPLAADAAAERPLAGVRALVLAQRPLRGVGAAAARVGAGVRLDGRVRAQVHDQVVAHGEGGGAARAGVRPAGGVHAPHVLPQVVLAGEDLAALGARVRLGRRVDAALVEAEVVLAREALVTKTALMERC